MSQSYDARNSSGVVGGDNLDRPVHGGIKPYELRGLGLNPEEVLDLVLVLAPRDNRSVYLKLYLERTYQLTLTLLAWN